MLKHWLATKLHSLGTVLKKRPQYGHYFLNFFPVLFVCNDYQLPHLPSSPKYQWHCGFVSCIFFLSFSCLVPEVRFNLPRYLRVLHINSSKPYACRKLALLESFSDSAESLLQFSGPASDSDSAWSFHVFTEFVCSAVYPDAGSKYCSNRSLYGSCKQCV